MSYPVTLYHDALERLQRDPITLREQHFDVLRAFNPADEVRGREAQRQAQLTRVAQAIDQASPEPGVLERTAVTSRLRPDAIARGIIEAVRPLHARIKALERTREESRDERARQATRLAKLEAHARAHAATLADLRDENKALGQLMADAHRRASSLDLAKATRH